MQELERLVETGRYLAATRRFEHMLHSGAVRPEDLAAGFHLASVAHYRLGELYAAKRCGERAYELAEEAGERALMFRSGRNMIEYLNALGDSHLALEYGQRWLEQAAAAGPEAPSGVGAVHYNLALVYRTRREHAEALRHFDQAAELLRAEGSTSFLIMCLQMSAWTRYELGHIAEADQLADEAQLYLLADPSDVEGRREQILLAAYRRFVLGEYQAAMTACEELLAIPQLSDMQRFWATYIVGAAAVQLYPLGGALAPTLREAAVTLAEVTLDLALKLRRPDFMNRAQQLRQEAQHLGLDQAG